MPPKSCFQRTADNPGGKSLRNIQDTGHSLISKDILFLPYRVNYIIKLELHTFRFCFFFQQKSISRAKNSLLLQTYFISCDIFQLQKKKKANIGLSLISISGLSFLNLFLTVCPFPYYLIMLPCDCELSMGPGWLSHHFEFILEAATGRNKNLGQQLLVKIFLPVS